MSETEYPVPEDLRGVYDTLREGGYFNDGRCFTMALIERIAHAEAQLAAANERIAELERIISSLKLADREKADSLNSYRVDLETAIGQRDEARMEVARLSAQVTDET